MPTTEILVAPLTAGSDIGDPDNAAAVVMKEVGDRLAATAGVQQIYFGTWVESPDTFQLLVNWDKMDSHKAFIATEVYQPFLQRFLTMTAGAPRMIHADMQPESEFSRAVAAPVTEVATFYFDGEAPADYLEGVEKFRQVIEKDGADGYLGACVGSTYEDDNEREGVKGQAAVVLIGWESVDKHMAFRETSSFKDNIKWLRNGAQKIEMHHVQFMEFVAG
ncbi:uncharacterized protein MYCFIDRAFT_70693 [Pseudocercospora fijiensis CIRAD86]|uniref:ABM domain-containing protein n=1 Tax=Pseudocercospora fijiensis (strain CIRAD86) TaxID=383855 RepID=M3A0N9_PSEFD|nr:uncharacterized protein MYCFIDRAFT_70693 [Pseudocercospora fijiensis CIRAD86]EME77976.1 hypothetical protein MYCFIDRAFT_70693 [Pseudocercospora fijiensis CIRAD86]